MTPGTRVGSYEVISILGSGGMGEVYRARDLKLGRDVAIKILPASVAGDPDRLARFEREARVLATLNHPHIGSIYGVEDSGDVRALVLELVEGPTLDERIARGPLPLSEALPIAIDIAAALETAHESGVVHRDLKPANIKLTKSGAAKVLDFGLAKTVHANDSSETQLATEVGTLVGTAAYMSPEQARGHLVDKRADVWAFGCVLFEMVTGTRVVKGETSLELLAEISSLQLDYSRLPATTPSTVRQVLERCLQKDPQQRLRDIGEARIALESILRGDTGRASTPALGAVTPKWLWPAVIGVVGVAIVVAVAIGWRGNRPAPAGERLEFSIAPPEGVVWGELPPDPNPVISPDGTRIVFYGRTIVGAPSLWVRDLGSAEARSVPDSQDVRQGSSFWSPDSTTIAYCTGSHIKKVFLDGRPSEQLAADCLSDASWSARGEILFAAPTGLFLIPASGGTATRVTTVDPSREMVHLFPRFLPDGQRFVFSIGSRQPDIAGIYRGSLGGGAPSRIVPDVSMSAYVDSPTGRGYLVYVKGSTLLAQRLTADGLVPDGAPIPLARQMGMGLGRRPSLSASSSLLVYRSGGAFGNTALVWIDRHGQRAGRQYGGQVPILSAALSHDEKTVAYGVFNRDTNNIELWSADVSRGVEQPLFRPPYLADDPVFSPDDRQIAFASSAEGGIQRVRIMTPGSTDEPSYPNSSDLSIQPGCNTADWSSDGRTILCTSPGGPTARVLAIPVGGASSGFQQILQKATQPSLSKDGVWLAYTSLESGTPEVFVQRFSDGQLKTRVSPAGGFQPRWRADGAEIFYLTDQGDVMAARIRTGARIVVEDPVRLFRERFKPDGSNYVRRDLLVTGDGQRFLVNLLTSEPKPLTAVRNWMNGLP